MKLYRGPGKRHGLKQTTRIVFIDTTSLMKNLSTLKSYRNHLKRIERRDCQIQ